jgi:hypothetical protein
MPIQYSSSGSSIFTTVVNDKASLCAAIDTALTGVGWTVATHTSSTDNVYQSALTAQNNRVCVRVWDAGGLTNCVKVRMMNVTQTISQADSCYFYVTTSTTVNIIASSYQFCIIVPGSLSSRQFILASALYIPPNLVTMGLTTAAFIQGNGVSDTDTTNMTGSFHTALTVRGMTGMAPAQGWTILNATTVEYNGSVADSYLHPGLPTLATLQSAAIDSIAGYRWHDDSALILEPFVAWGTPNIDSEAKLRGQLWDAFISTESYPADISTMVDTHNFYNVTASNNGSVTSPASMRGSLFICTS